MAVNRPIAYADARDNHMPESHMSAVADVVDAAIAGLGPSVGTATTLTQGILKVDDDSGGNPVALTVVGHDGAADPHPQYALDAEKGQVNGYASLDGSGKVPTSQLPAAALLSIADVIDALYPVGALYSSTLNTNPGTLLGRGTWAAFGAGRVQVGYDAANPNFNAGEKTGGAENVAAAGTVSQPIFTGSALATHSHTLTPAGTVSQPTFTGTANQNTSAVSAGTPAGTVAWPAGVPTFTGSALGTHQHELPFQKVAGGTGVLRMLAASVFGTGTSRAAESVSAAPTANTTAAAVELTQAVSAGTPAGTIAWPVGVPTFAGSALGTHQHTVTATGTVSQPTFTGTTNQPTSSDSAGTPAGTVSQPTFTGSGTSVLQPYVTVFMWKRTA